MSILYTILSTYFVLAISASFLVFPAFILSGRFSHQEDLCLDTIELNED